MQLYFGDKSNVESSKIRLTKWILPISDISYSNSVKKREEIMFRVIPELAVYLIFIHPFPLSPFNSPCLPLKILHNQEPITFSSPGYYSRPKRN